MNKKRKFYIRTFANIEIGGFKNHIMNEKEGAGKAGLNDALKEIMNGILEEGNEKLRVEEVDTGIFVCPIVNVEHIKSPAYKEDLKKNTGMLVDIKVREVIDGLLNGVLMWLHINGRREVEIKRRAIDEVEIRESDLNDSKLRKDWDKIQEEKTNKVSRVVKVALEQIMSDEKAE